MTRTRIPKLAEMHCSRIQFNSGDRILVKVFRDLSTDDVRKIRKSIEKWAGDGIPVLIVDARTTEIIVDKQNRPSLEPSHGQSGRVIY